MELMLGQIDELPERTDDAGRAAAARDADTPARLAVNGLGSGTALEDVSFSVYPGEVLGVVALEGQGQDELFDILAGAIRPSQRRGPGRWQRGLVPSSRRRDPGRPRVHRRGPGGGAPDAALGAREHLAAGCRQPSAVGADRSRSRERQGPQVRRHAADRRARRRRGPAPVGRQPAEGHDRPLGDRWRAHDALLRSDPRHRYPHQGPDLHPAPRAGRGRRRDPPLHVRAQGDPARV